jgi:hypothetical protein
VRIVGQTFGTGNPLISGPSKSVPKLTLCETTNRRGREAVETGKWVFCVSRLFRKNQVLKSFSGFLKFGGVRWFRGIVVLIRCVVSQSHYAPVIILFTFAQRILNSVGTRNGSQKVQHDGIRLYKVPKPKSFLRGGGKLGRSTFEDYI